MAATTPSGISGASNIQDLKAMLVDSGFTQMFTSSPLNWLYKEQQLPSCVRQLFVYPSIAE